MEEINQVENRLELEKAYSKIEKLKASLDEAKGYQREWYEKYQELNNDFKEQVRIQVALAVQKYSEQYMTFVDKMTELIKVLKEW